MERLIGIVVVFALFLVFAAGCGEKAVNNGQKQEDDAQKARQAFVDHLEKDGTAVGTKNPKDYDIEMKPLGSSTWLVFATFKKRAPGSTVIYIADKKGVRAATLQNLVYAHASEFAVSSNENDHRKIIESIVKIHSSNTHRHSAIMISSTKDIPGYHDPDNGIHGNRHSRPLDADFRDVVRQSWKQEISTTGYLYYVVYSYNQMDGCVGRYKFQFNASERDAKGQFHLWRIYTADHIVIGTNVGDFRGRD
jgi:hypothetical protein